MSLAEEKTDSRPEGLLAAVRSGDWLGPDRVLGYSRLILAIEVLLAAAWLFFSKGLIDPAGHPIGTDFLNVYAAGLMGLKGQFAQVYDWQLHGAVEHSIIAYDGYYGWHYPPMFLAVALAVALFPYPLALSLYLGAGLAAYIAALKPLIPDFRRYWVAAAAFPGVLINLGHGQNGFITTALFTGALLLLGRRPVMAGILFGLMAYKPQFGLLIPVALIAGGHWRTILAAGLTVAAVLAASLAAFGIETFEAFLNSTHLTGSIILEEGATGWEKIQSVFAAVRALGGDIALAYGVQGLSTVVAAIVVAMVWRSRASADIKAAVLGFAIPLSTPYVLDYDLMILAAPIAFLARAGLRSGFGPYEKTLLVTVWLLPLLARSIGSMTLLHVTPVILALMLAVLVRRPSATAA